MRLGRPRIIAAQTTWKTPMPTKNAVASGYTGACSAAAAKWMTPAAAEAAAAEATRILVTLMPVGRHRRRGRIAETGVRTPTRFVQNLLSPCTFCTGLPVPALTGPPRLQRVLHLPGRLGWAVPDDAPGERKERPTERYQLVVALPVPLPGLPRGVPEVAVGLDGQLDLGVGEVEEPLVASRQHLPELGHRHGEPGGLERPEEPPSNS